jgi:GAF domain-containing protein/anti-sigma regulatory factor (Ser/Thr protein kinase)
VAWRDARGPLQASRFSRYAAGVLLALVAVTVTSLLTRATDEPVFTVMLGAVALATWYGGLGPGLVAIVAGWGAGWFLLDPVFSPVWPESAAITRWATALVAAIVIVTVLVVLRRGRDRAATAADEAEALRDVTAEIQGLTSALSAAVTPSDVARALVELVPGLVGARGGALGLIEGSELVIVDPRGPVDQTLAPGLRLPLATRAPITRAAREGIPVVAHDRATFRREYPDGAALAPYAYGAVAVPIRAAGTTVGSMGFPFGRADFLTDRTLAVAQIAADLGGQALERAELYEDERSLRRALDAILRTAPRFAGSTYEEALVAVCDEARATFSADIAQMWSRTGADGFALRWRSPPDPSVPPGTDVHLEDFPGLVEALQRLQPSFVTDVQTALQGASLERVRRQNIRSSLRIPIAIGGEVGRVLVLQWRHIAPEPGPSQMLLARRYADQAGLVLEQLERRAAEGVAARAAVETKRLLDVTSVLTSAAGLPDVSRVVLDEAFRSLQARAGVFVVGRQPDEQPEVVEARTATGEDTVDSATLALVSDALARGTLLAAESPEAMRRWCDDEPLQHESWLAIPLTAGRKVVGGLGLAFDERRGLGPADLDFARFLGRQAGASLERAQLYESERTIAETLQQSVLPESLPVVDGVQMAARYLPGTAAVDVGGDWFDAIPLGDGKLGLAVGDVVGKGVKAAATMSQLRNGLRAFAFDQMRPSSTVSRLNRLAGEVDESAFATLLYAVVDTERRVVRYTAAGHPPPLVVYPDRRTEFAEGGRCLPLGVSSEAVYEQGVIELPTGSTIVLFTDGLVERRDRSITDGLERLRTAAAEAPGDPERLVDHVLDALVGEDVRGDDVAVLAVRLLAAAPAPLDLRLPSTPRSLDLVRDALRTWLERAPLSQEEAREVVLAAWEACANAIEHPQEARTPVFTVRARAASDRVLLDVMDTGHWRNGRTHPDRGLGLQLVRSVMSAVTVVRGQDGTRVHMEKEAAAAPSR